MCCIISAVSSITQKIDELGCFHTLSFSIAAELCCEVMKKNACTH